MPSLSTYDGSGTSQTTRVAGLKQRLEEGSTALIGDTLHFETLGIYDFDGTTINPASITEALDLESVYYHVWAAVKQTIDERVSRRVPNTGLVKASLERLLFELGNIIIYRVEGPHFTFVDPRRHQDTEGMIRNAQRLVRLFEEKQIRRDKIVISIPATNEGVQAAQELENEHGIHTNLYLVSGLLHAAACAEAGATTITIPVGRLLNWYERKRKAIFKDLNEHPGVETIQSTLSYFKLHGIKSKVIGSEFRTLDEIGPLADFDAICFSKDQAEASRWSQTPLSTPLPSSSAYLRARQAQYPTTLLSSKSGFMEALSAETRSIVAATLFVPLGEMKAQMDYLEKIVGKEVSRQFKLQTLDLKTLYRCSSPKNQKIKRTAGDLHTPERAKGKRSLAKDLDLEGEPNAQQEDEVF